MGKKADTDPGCLGAPRRSAYLTLPRAVYLLFAVRLINAAGSFVLPFLTMILTRKLGWSSPAAGTFLTIVSLCGLAWSLASGKIADHFGRRALIAASQAAACALFIACAAIGTGPALPWLLAPAMIILSGTWPVFNAVVADLVPPDRRKEAFSLLYWGNNLGFALGPLAAGLLFEKHTAWMFAGNAAALASVSALFVFGLGAYRPRGGKDPAEVAVLDPEVPAGERDVKGSVFAALAARPVVLGYALIAILLSFVYGQHLFSLPIRLGTLFGEGGPAVYGRLMSLNAITVVALTLPATRLLKRLSPLYCMAVAAAFYALGFGLHALARAEWSFYALTVAWTIGEIVSATSAGAFVASRSPGSHRGRFSAVVNFISSTGGVLCPVLSGAFIKAFGDMKIWILAGLVSTLGAILMGVLARRDSRSGQDRA